MAPFFDPFQDVVLVNVGRVVAGHVFGRKDLVGRLDRRLAEAQVGDGHPARFFGVVGKVGLGVKVGVVADDLDGRLVGPHGAVGPQAPELAADGVAGGDAQQVFELQGGVGDIVLDADGEVVFGDHHVHVVEDRLDHAGVELLGPQPVAAVDDQGGLHARSGRAR